MDIVPHAWQAACLSLWDVEEVFVGGAAGPGKSMYLLLDAAQFADHPASHSLLLRTSLAEMRLAGNLLDTAKTKLWGTERGQALGIKYNERDMRFTFPSGATVVLGHLEDEKALGRYLGTEWTMIGFDEASQMNPAFMSELNTRQRRVGNHPVPIRRRWASNPGGPSHSWIRQKFVKAKNTRDRIYIPGNAKDNPHLSAQEYHDRINRSEISETRKKQLVAGDWDAVDDTGKFNTDKLNWFRTPPSREGMRMVRFWDLASTEKNARNLDPDYTVGIKMGEKNGEFFILDMIRGRWGEGRVFQIIQETAEADGVNCPVRVEREPGSAGKFSTYSLARWVLSGYDMLGIPSTGDKAVRANPFASAMENGLVHIREASWAYDVVSELSSAGQGHDDIRDGLSGAHKHLTTTAGEIFVK